MHVFFLHQMAQYHRNIYEKGTVNMIYVYYMIFDIQDALALLDPTSF